MNRLIRFLLMFGPMIFRQYQKYQNKKQREQAMQSRLPQNNPNSSRHKQQDYSNSPPKDGKYYRSPNQPIQHTKRNNQTKKATPTPTPQEDHFNMKEEEFMLDPTTEAEYAREMRDISNNQDLTNEQLASEDRISLDLEPDIESPNTTNTQTNNPIQRHDDDAGFKLRDLFIKPEDDVDQDS